MESLCILVAHLIGDYLWQNDWMASRKTAPRPGPKPPLPRLPDGSPIHRSVFEHEMELRLWAGANRKWWFGNLACTVHCACYTLAFCLCCFWFMPWWGYLVIFLVHWPIDRYRLAYWWMTNVSEQKSFATGPLAPWSVIVVDNTFHLITVLVVMACAS